MGRIYQLFKTHRLQSIYFGALIITISIFSTLLLPSKSVSAAEPETATGKALAWGLKSCVRERGLGQDIYINNGTKNGGIEHMFPNGKMDVPTYYGNTSSRSSVSCTDALLGGPGFQGLLSRNKINLNDVKTRDNFYKSLGYKKDRDGNYHLKKAVSPDEFIKVVTKKSSSSFNTNDLERFKMYSFMLTNVYKVKPDNCRDSKVKDSVAVVKNGKIQYCKIPSSPPVPQVGNLQTPNFKIKAFHKTKNAMDEFNYYQLVSALNSSAKKLKKEDIKDIKDSANLTNYLGSGKDDDGATDMEACFNNAGAFGWVMCPLISGLHGIADSLYKHVEGWLGVHPSIVASIRPGSASDVFRLWSKFRDIANIAFVIVFLIVILSQVSGFGISNYNVKKMLPKLVVTAILVNASFILCALAVDVSNIVGSSTKRLLTGMGENIAASCILGKEASACDSSNIVGNITTATMVLAGAGATAKATGAIAAIKVAGWTLLGPILIFLLTLAIAIFFAFAILGVRQALVVILIATSPIAFVLNVLPNTEGIFKKWQKLFSGVLLMFPICGLLVGGGYVASRLLLSVASTTADATNASESGNVPIFLNLLISGTILVAPYFFIPGLVTRTLDSIGKLAGLGALGSRLGRLSGSAQKRASSGIKSTNAYKDNMTNMKSNLQRHYDQKTIDKLDKKQKDKGRLSFAENRRLNTATKRVDAMIKQDQEDYANMFGNGLANVYDSDGNAIIQDATNNGQVAEAFAHLANKTNRTNDEDIQMLALYDLAMRRAGIDDLTKVLKRDSKNFSTETRQLTGQNAIGKWLKDIKNGDPQHFEWAIGAQSAMSNEEIQAEIAQLQEQYNSTPADTPEKEKAFKQLRSAKAKLDMNYATGSKVMSKATGSTLNNMEPLGLETLAKDLSNSAKHPDQSKYTKTELESISRQLKNVLQADASGAQPINERVRSKLYTDDVLALINQYHPN